MAGTVTKQPKPRKQPASRGVPRKRSARSTKTALAAFLAVHGRRGAVLGAEILAWAGISLIAVIAVLGRAADRFAGVSLWTSLVPFAGMVLLLAMLLFFALRIWLVIRATLARRADFMPAALSLAVAFGTGWFAAGDEFRRELGNLRGLVGGVREAERITLSHQVYAAYRRADLIQMKVLVERAKPFQPVIQEAASIYGVDAEVLMGVGAAESSFLPRDSKDGGRGLFQITAPPKSALDQVSRQLDGTPLDWRNQRHNALIAAATYRHYLQQMRDDLFLALLAYNIGPKNGGLLSIMRQYGARDFATIQPYLQNLPRDYPIRVLTAALAFRLWGVEGRLPRYEDGDNAKRIQAIGIPGLF